MMCNSDRQPIQELEFLNVTILPNRSPGHDEHSRRVVRSHAIRDANRRKRLALPPNSEQASDNFSSKPKPQSSFVAKFRLNKKAKRKSSPVRDKEVDSNFHEVSESAMVVEGQPQQLDMFLSPGDLDPFQTLPGSIGPRARLILKSYISSRPTVFTYFSRQRLFSCSLADSAWFYATLSMMSLCYDMAVGQSISSECLFYRREALRVVTERLSQSPAEHEITNHTIAAIASLANIDTITGSVKSASMHVDGLVGILNRKGGIRHGLDPFQGIEMLEKMVAWSDLSHSNVHDVCPRFPVLRSRVCTGSLSDYLEFAMALFTTPPDVTSPHDLFGQMTSIFQSLRILSLAMVRPKITPEVQSLFSRGLYITEYKLLTVLDATGPDDAYNGIVLNRNSHIYGSCRLAAYLYLYMVLVELPTGIGIVKTVVRRLRRLVEVEDANLLGLWREDMHMLLWILSMGAITRGSEEDGEYFVGTLRRVVQHMELRSFEEYKQAIREVCWIKADLWNNHLSDLWKDTTAASSPKS